MWDDFYSYLVEDYPRTSIGVNEHQTNLLLHDLNDLLLQHGKRTTNFDLLVITMNHGQDTKILRLIEEELLIPILNEDLAVMHSLNNDKKNCFRYNNDYYISKRIKCLFHGWAKKNK